jgi:hypothetical protein
MGVPVSERRWGRVTVEGWIREDALASRNYVMVFGTQRAEEAPAVIYTTPTGAYRVSVEFLPEPVTFKDGDVLKHVEPSLWLRHGGLWYSGGPQEYDGPVYDDKWAAQMLRGNLAVRLVPEANGD